MKSLLLIIFHFATIATLQAQPPATITGDFADPSFIRVKETYYATATSSEWAPHFPIYASKDLHHWKQTGYIFSKAPEWTSSSFWAPEYYQIGSTYYLYYTARRKSDGHSFIGVATSKYPDRGFEDHGVLVAFGNETIDAFVFNDKGQLYITFKAYGLTFQPTEILAQKLSADGLHLEGEPFSLLKDDERKGLEGQSILKKGKYYYLFYSAGSCCGGDCSYHVQVARSERFTGPYEKYSEPLLTGGNGWKCTGHGTFVTAAGGKTFYLHHAYSTSNGIFTGRQGLIAQLTWPQNEGWPVLSEQPTAKTSGNNNIKANFSSNQLAPYWQWDFRHANPIIKQERGKLILSGTVKENNLTGIALTVRPTSDNFSIQTTVANSNTALKGLVFYGDANAAVGVGVTGNSVEYWMVKDNKRTVLATDNLPSAAPVELQLTMQPDKTAKAFYRQGKTAWKELGNTPVDVGFLPQWDRSPRPGLLFKGEAGSVAEFSSFEMINR